jgi:hypothetical protein
VIKAQHRREPSLGFDRHANRVEQPVGSAPVGHELDAIVLRAVEDHVHVEDFKIERLDSPLVDAVEVERICPRSLLGEGALSPQPHAPASVLRGGEKRLVGAEQASRALHDGMCPLRRRAMIERREERRRH